MYILYAFYFNIKKKKEEKNAHYATNENKNVLHFSNR